MTRLASAGAPDATVDEALQVLRTVVPGFEPVRWERLKRGKSDVFAVHGRDARAPLVAKRAQADTICVEHRVLEWCAAGPFTSLQAHGTATAARPGCAWLVSEYAAGEPYDRRSSVHRRLAGSWLGAVHAWSASAPPPSLPNRGPGYHHEVVAAACQTLEDAAHDGGALTDQDRGTARCLAGDGRELLGRWVGVAAVLAQLPTTLVHSGIAAKNVRVVTGPARTAVLAFDWEQAGWGCPAADLSMVDLASYAARAGQAGIRLPDTRLVSAIGQLLWCFAAIPGERINLLGPWPQGALHKLEFYLGQVRAAMPVLRAAVRP